ARKGHGNARLDPGFAGGAALRRPGGKLFGLDRAWDGETRPCRSGNCAPTSLTLRGAQMDLGPPGFLMGGMPGLATATIAPAVAHHGSSIGSTISSLIDSGGTFLSQLANLSWGALLVGLALYAVYLLLRSRALWGALRAAYPGVPIRWRDVWGAYMVGYAINNVFPLGGGSVAQVFLTRVAIPPSSYPTVAAGLSTGVIFDWFMGLLVMCF